jgi:hypothetical protein
LSPTELANRVGFTTGGITTVVGRLEQAGYVRRVADPRDRRRRLIEKTAKTSERDHEVFGGLARMTLESLAAYSENELAAIQRFLEGRREITARHAEDLARDAVAGPGGCRRDGTRSGRRLRQPFDQHHVGRRVAMAQVLDRGILG